MLWDGLLCQCLFHALLLKSETPKRTPRKRNPLPQKTTSSETIPATISPLTSSPLPNDTLPLQGDLFTGRWVDNRSEGQRKADQERTQPAQMTLFRQREIAQFGVRAHPQMSLSPHTKLVLITEDPRTEEEKERDTQRAAEALTMDLFPEAPLTLEDDETFPASSVEPPPLLELPEEPPEPTADVGGPRLAVYLRLVHLAEVGESTGAAYPEGFVSHVALTVLDAIHYGLQRAEIHAALQIGTQRRQHKPDDVQSTTGETALEASAEDTPTPHQLSLLPENKTLSKLQTYLKLIQVVETHTRMGLSPTGKQWREVEPFAQALAAEAAKAGLADGEIQAALTIAAFRAGRRLAMRERHGAC
jgi:hypothetical protein